MVLKVVNAFFLFSKQSLLLRKISLRTNQHQALPHLNSVVVGNSSKLPEFLVTQKHSLCLLTSILNVMHTLFLGQHRKLFADLFASFWTTDLTNYLDQLATQTLNDSLRRNWFVRSEIMFLIDLLKCGEVREKRLDKKTLQKIGYRVSTFLTEDQISHVLFLFDSVIFENSLYAQSIGQTQYVMLLWKRIYQHICFNGVQTIDPDGLMVSNYGRLVLPAEWPYQPVLNVLRSVTEQAQGGGTPGKIALFSTDSTDVFIMFRASRARSITSLSYVYLIAKDQRFGVLKSHRGIDILDDIASWACRHIP